MSLDLSCVLGGLNVFLFELRCSKICFEHYLVQATVLVYLTYGKVHADAHKYIAKTLIRISVSPFLSVPPLAGYNSSYM